MALGEDRELGSGLGSSGSGVRQWGNHAMNTQGNIILGQYSKSIHQLPC